MTILFFPFSWPNTELHRPGGGSSLRFIDDEFRQAAAHREVQGPILAAAFTEVAPAIQVIQRSTPQR